MADEEESQQYTLIKALEELVQTRHDFFDTNFIRSFPYQAREMLMTRYFASEIRLTDLLSRFYNMSSLATGARALLTFSASPALNENFMDPVLVLPSQTQIRNALQIIPTSSTTNTNCAICQDSISVDGVQLRQCHHVYHRECIMAWFQRNVRCPVCRHDIREEDHTTQTSSASSQTSSRLPGQLEEH
jgi:hypothetical protein